MLGTLDWWVFKANGVNQTFDVLYCHKDLWCIWAVTDQIRSWKSVDFPLNKIDKQSYLYLYQLEAVSHVHASIRGLNSSQTNSLDLLFPEEGDCLLLSLSGHDFTLTYKEMFYSSKSTLSLLNSEMRLIS